jgi:large subunit ribosomal protein L1
LYGTLTQLEIVWERRLSPPRNIPINTLYYMSKTTQPIQKIKGRSKKYSSNAAKIAELTKNEVVDIQKAVETLYTLEHSNFKDGVSVELHVKLNINPTKSDQFVRGNLVLPHGTGKKTTIAAFVTEGNVEKAKKAGAQIVGGEDLIEELKNSGKINFDIAIAEQEMMKKLPVIARLLGTAGVMPNPKTGTVGDNIEEMITLIKKGKVDFKNDKSGNIHILCGKLNDDFTIEKIVENVTVALDAVEKAKPEAVKKKFVISAHLACSMSPSVKIA